MGQDDVDSMSWQPEWQGVAGWARTDLNDAVFRLEPIGKLCVTSP